MQSPSRKGNLQMTSFVNGLRRLEIHLTPHVKQVNEMASVAHCQQFSIAGRVDEFWRVSDDGVHVGLSIRRRLHAEDKVGGANAL